MDFKNKKDNEKSLYSNESDSAEQKFPEISEILDNLENSYDNKAVEIMKNPNVIESEKVVSINNLEDVYVKKLEDYENEILSKEDNLINNLENEIQNIVLKKNEIDQELEQKNVDDSPHKNPELLKKLSEIYKKKADEINKNLEDEKKNRKDLENQVNDYVENLINKTVQKIENENLIPIVDKNLLKKRNSFEETRKKLLDENDSVEEIPLKRKNNIKEKKEEINYPYRRQNHFVGGKTLSSLSNESDIGTDSESSEELNFPILTMKRKNAMIYPKKSQESYEKERVSNIKKNFYLSFEKNLDNKKDTSLEDDLKFPTLKLERQKKFYPTRNPEEKTELEKDLKKHFLQKILKKGQNVKCSKENKNSIKKIFATLALKNKFQSIDLFDENFLECSTQIVNGIKYKAILSFNDEKCFIEIWHQAWMEDGIKIGYEGVEGVRDGFMGVEGGDMDNCVDRVGTEEMIESVKQVKEIV